MAEPFSTRIIREWSKERNRILDAGCGSGARALYLARRRPALRVIGYDIDQEAICKAETLKQRHTVPNAYFFVASHDDFQSPHEMDMIYTAGSLVGENEINDPCVSPIFDAEELIRRRLTRFRDMLSPAGIYVLTWRANGPSNELFAHIAQDCGLELAKQVQYGAPDFDTEAKSALIFQRS